MVDTVKEYGYQWWIGQLDEAEKRLRQDWWTSADAIVKKYKAKKTDADSEGKQYLLNIFWANIGVMKAALYAKPPKPMVERTWSDMNDNVGRVAALMLQRCLAFDFIKNTSPMSEAFKKAVEDRLIPGLGCIWMRYTMTPETVTIAASAPGGEPVKMEVVSEEDAPCDYVHWRDIVYPAARTWEEVWFVARKIYLTPGEFKKRFKKKVDSDASRTVPDIDKILPTNFAKGKVTIYEIWCKRTNKIYWISREVNSFCMEKDDFLELDDFYPCPKFLLSTHTTDDFLARPDYTMVRDQYEQLNELNTRCTILEQALRVVGVYDKKNAELANILTVARENDMIAVDKWAMLGEQGGLKGAVDWFPIEQIAIVLEKLTVQKAEKIQEIFQLTGISDIMRGDTNPRETLGAQQLKSQYSSVRLQYLQGEVSTFVRETLVIKAQIICRHFQDETIIKWSNLKNTPDAQYIPQALAMLRDSQMTEYRIDINEEGLALPDYNQEKQTRIEFLTTVGQFLSQAAQVVTVVPGSMPYLIQMVRWVAAGLRGSNEIQGVLDSAITALQNAPQQAHQAPQPDPTKIAAENIKQQGENQRLTMKIQADAGLMQKEKDLELRNRIKEILAAHGVDMQELQAEIMGDSAVQQQTSTQDQQQRLLEHTLTTRENAQTQNHEAVMANMDQSHQAGMAQQDRAHEAGMARQSMAHDDASAQRDQAFSASQSETDHQHARDIQAHEPKPVKGK